MNPEHPTGRRGGIPATFGLILLPLLCCGLPLLIAAGALGVVGSVLGNPWVIDTAALLVLGLIGYTFRKR